MKTTATFRPCQGIVMLFLAALIPPCLTPCLAAPAAPAPQFEDNDDHTSIGAGRPPPSPSARHILARNPDWAPYGHTIEIEPGGAFDFSHLLDAPAGKYGALRATAAGHFEFTGRPGHPVRFWGVNLTFTANYPGKPGADLLAERLARSGYNTVRFHHYDKDLVRPGGDSWELDPRKLDQLDYLFAALKKRGIYINIDLFSARVFSDAELRSFGLQPEGMSDGRRRSGFKVLVPINEAAFESWKKFATNLLTHRNPYTGQTWAGDPALIGICPVNEDTLSRHVSSNAALRAHYEAAFDAARRAATTAAPATSPSAATTSPSAATASSAAATSSPDASPAAATASPAAAPRDETPAQRDAAFARFVFEIQARSDARKFAHLRALGVKALLTGANHTHSQGLAYVREHYDYVDIHHYWAHPTFPGKAWSFPLGFRQDSPIRALAILPTRLMPVRILGKPFTVTEFNFVRPNRHRAEGAILMPAYASLQDWDALYNFQYAMSRKLALEGGIENYFSLASDPIGLIGDRIGAVLFRRGDIAPATRTVAWAVRRDEALTDLKREFPPEFFPVGFVSQIGSLTGEPAGVWKKRPDLSAVVTGPTASPPLPPRTYLATGPDSDAVRGASLAARLQHAGVLPPGSVHAGGKRFTSDTGQIEIDAAAGTLKVVTPRSELFHVPPGARLDGNRVSIENVTAGAAVSIIALDPAPLAATRRILVTHLTDALPEGMEFETPERTLLLSWGRGPHLVRRGDTTLRLRLPDGGWKAWSLAASGRRIREIPLRKNGSEYVLTLSTITPEGTQLAYELERSVNDE
ncbi:MAG: glycosyl hydrolase family 5 [Opitutaceae bacterium]|jgi:hypothetical protein|nr:glycosyl hydrolase family 5 [Opitutaceae bacterium]